MAGKFTDGLAQIWTSIPETVRDEIEEYCKEQMMPPSVVYRKLIVEYYKQIIGGKK